MAAIHPPKTFIFHACTKALSVLRNALPSPSRVQTFPRQIQKAIRKKYPSQPKTDVPRENLRKFFHGSWGFLLVEQVKFRSILSLFKTRIKKKNVENLFAVKPLSEKLAFNDFKLPRPSDVLTVSRIHSF